MSYLLVGDLHLTDRPRDAYRFGIFEWIRKQQERYKVKATFIMGDLCDQKDRHSAALVNRVVDALTDLCETYILMGNHDYIDRETPFFKFLNKLEGVSFITKPSVFGDVGAIPHCKTQEQFDEACEELNHVKYLLVHNTFEGAISETGKKLSGLSWSQIQWPNPQCVYAGDIHRPQHTDKITYVGSPYHIRFGDDFQPRCLLVKGDMELTLHFDCPRKWKLTVRDAEEITLNKDLREGDQVKVTVELAREEAVEWQNYKKQVREACEKRGLEVFAINLKVNTHKKKTKDVKVSATPADIVTSFCKSEGVGSQVREAGLSIIKE
jgi:DNA repair exonuclease SbcCD nuclease subunit